ncbi:MAG: DUF664 domain-containing protein [candidate division Zixibacteria bacterium]|nr:DUF664 domain-containing protein [candidate division Zixibacteria bacterium]
MIPIPDYIELYEHNQRLKKIALDSLKTIDWDKARTENVCGLGSIGNLISHTMEAADWWLTSVLKGEPFNDYIYEDFTDIESFREKWDDVDNRFISYIGSLKKENLDEERKVKWDKEFTFKVKDILIHVYTHTVHHRGQIVMAIRNLGGKPEETDIL